jgi:hypothetical protein
MEYVPAHLPLPPGEREMRAEILSAGAEGHTLCMVENNWYFLKSRSNFFKKKHAI